MFPGAAPQPDRHDCGRADHLHRLRLTPGLGRSEHHPERFGGSHSVHLPLQSVWGLEGSMRQPFRRIRSGRLFGLVPLLLAGSLVMAAPAMAEPPAAGPPAAALEKPEQPSPGDDKIESCLLYTSPSPRDGLLSRMPSS